MQTLGSLWPVTLALTLGCGGGTGSAGSADAPETGTTTTSLASGQLALSAATSFEELGFHQSFVLEHVLDSERAAPAGARLILRLWDADRPEQTCDQEHPLSGCATIDWSDALGRPNVPDTGVFDNRVTIELASGPRDFYLTEARGLADTPDPQVPS